MPVSAVDMSSLSLFRREMSRFPRLSREEEYRLAKRWCDHKDRDAAKQLVCANLSAVAGIVREYSHFGLPEVDLIQEGAMGLMHAVRRFDPERGFRLATYAAWWIRASIQDFILRSWSIVRLGTNKVQRRIFAGLRHARESIAALEGKDRKEVASQYGMSEATYQQTANAYLQRDLSLDAEEGSMLAGVLPAAEPTPEQQILEHDWTEKRQTSLHHALKQLPERDRYIIEQRHMHDESATLKTLAEALGVSIERVRQIEKRAMQKLHGILSVSSASNGLLIPS